uniref:CCHC-type domain-containing protein n=1 Tax=Strongyloides venezuelensis TaxID=75913 RepID=A0A0K0FPK8_STRVS
MKNQGWVGRNVTTAVETGTGKAGEKKKNKKLVCFNCDKEGHRSIDYRGAVAICAVSGKEKHLAKYCFKNRKANASSGGVTAAGHALQVVACIMGLKMISVANATEDRWERPEYMEDYIIYTAAPKCVNYYIPMLWNQDTLYLIKGSFAYVVAAGKKEYGVCPCEGKGKGFKRGGNECYQFYTIKVADEQPE